MITRLSSLPLLRPLEGDPTNIVALHAAQLACAGWHAPQAVSLRVLSLDMHFHTLPPMASLRHLLLPGAGVSMGYDVASAIQQLAGLETLYLEGELVETEAGEVYTYQSRPLDLRGCPALRAVSMKHLTPEEVLVPGGCQVKLHTDLGRAYLHWQTLSQAATHAVIFARRCPDALSRLQELTFERMACLTFLHLQCPALGSDSHPYFLDARYAGARLEHLFLECSNLHLLLGQGLRLRTLALYARTSFKLTMDEINTLEAFHITCKGKDLIKTADALLLNPFRHKGELEWGGEIPIHKLPHDMCSMSYPECARTPAQLLSSHRCGACPACLQGAGILHDPPGAPVEYKPCFQSIMKSSMRAALQASSGQDTLWDLCRELRES